MARRRFDILSDPISDITNSCLSAAWGGTKIEGATDFSALSVLSRCKEEDSDFSTFYDAKATDIPEEEVDYIRISDDPMSPPITRAEELGPRDTDSPFIQPARIYEPAGMFGAALKAHCNLRALCSEDEKTVNKLDAHFKKGWEIGEEVDFDQMTPTLRSAGATKWAGVGRSLRTESGTNPHILKHVRVKLGGVTRKNLDERKLVDWARLKAVAAAIVGRLAAEDPQYQVTHGTMFWHINRRELPDVPTGAHLDWLPDVKNDSTHTNPLMTEAIDYMRRCKAADKKTATIGLIEMKAAAPMFSVMDTISAVRSMSLMVRNPFAVQTSVDLLSLPDVSRPDRRPEFAVQSFPSVEKAYRAVIGALALNLSHELPDKPTLSAIRDKLEDGLDTSTDEKRVVAKIYNGLTSGFFGKVYYALGRLAGSDSRKRAKFCEYLKSRGVPDGAFAVSGWGGMFRIALASKYFAAGIVDDVIHSVGAVRFQFSRDMIPVSAGCNALSRCDTIEEAIAYFAAAKVRYWVDRYRARARSEVALVDRIRFQIRAKLIRCAVFIIEEDCRVLGRLRVPEVSKVIVHALRRFADHRRNSKEFSDEFLKTNVDLIANSKSDVAAARYFDEAARKLGGEVVSMDRCLIESQQSVTEMSADVGKIIDNAHSVALGVSPEEDAEEKEAKIADDDLDFKEDSVPVQVPLPIRIAAPVVEVKKAPEPEEISIFDDFDFMAAMSAPLPTVVAVVNCRTELTMEFERLNEAAFSAASGIHGEMVAPANFGQFRLDYMKFASAGAKIKEADADVADIE